MAHPGPQVPIIKLWKVQGQVVFPQREYLIGSYEDLPFIDDPQFGDMAYDATYGVYYIYNNNDWATFYAPTTYIIDITSEE